VTSQNPLQLRRVTRQRTIEYTLIVVLLAVVVASFCYFTYLWPNDQRIPFRFPGIQDAAPARQIVYSFIDHVAEARIQSDRFESSRLQLVLRPAVNANRRWHSSDHAVHVSLREDSARTVRRHALYAPASTTYEFHVDVPPNGLLEFDCGVLSPGPAVRFLIEAVDEDGKTATLFSTESVPDSSPSRSFIKKAVRRVLHRPVPPDERWIHGTVRFGNAAGKKTTLRFKTVPVSPADSPEPAHAFWANPRLWGPANPNAPTRNNLIVLVVDPLNWSSLGAHGFKKSLTPNMDRFIHEGIDSQIVYSNGNTPRLALPSLLASRWPFQMDFLPFGNSLTRVEKERFYMKKIPTLPTVLREKGYQTAAIGSLPEIADGSPEGIDWGFDEAVLFDHPGYEPAHIAQETADWLARNRDNRPFCLFVFFSEPRTDTLIPIRFFARALPKLFYGGIGLEQWSYLSQLAYIDEYVGWLFSVMDALKTWDDGLVSFLSMHGIDFQPKPVLLDGQPAFGVLTDPGLNLREGDVRVVWAMKHPSMPQGQKLPGPVQLLDFSPVILSILDIAPPPGFRGRAQSYFSAPSYGEGSEPAPLLLTGLHCKGFISEGHLKYIRHEPIPLRFTKKSIFGDKSVVTQFDEEEVYDLWMDPDETVNLARRDRSTLSMLRRTMDAHNPDRTRTVITVNTVPETPLEGTLRIPGGQLERFRIAGGTSQAWSGQLDFKISENAGTVSFETDPSTAPFTLQLRQKQRSLPPSAYTVSTINLPLLEQQHLEWYDANSFPLLRGTGNPRPGNSSQIHIERQPVFGEAP